MLYKCKKWKLWVPAYTYGGQLLENPVQYTWLKRHDCLPEKRLCDEKTHTTFTGGYVYYCTMENINKLSNVQ